jgi:hypothetical protein
MEDIQQPKFVQPKESSGMNRRDFLATATPRQITIFSAQN